MFLDFAIARSLFPFHHSQTSGKSKLAAQTQFPEAVFFDASTAKTLKSLFGFAL
jgi:hypothetical protein